MDRRSFLIGSFGAAGLFAAPGSSAAEADPLTAEIEIDGRTYRYAEAASSDLGDYADPEGRFVQTCRLARDPGLPAMAVMFRRDRGSDRAEAVFELGRVSAAPGEPADLGPYRVRIWRGETRVAAVDVPRHHWFARWRWQSALRPVRANIRTLAANGLLLPLEIPAHMTRKRPDPYFSYEVMGLAGLASGMGATGDRPDIGPITEYQAEYACTGNPAALSTMMAQAEAGGTVPWNIRDERTHAPVDTLAYQEASLYPNRGKPHIESVPNPAVVPDSAHQPAVAYLPFVLTGDPYHLETLQFQAAWNVLAQPPDWRYRIGQVRAHAWSLRTLAGAARVTPAAVPQWLLPQRHWRALLDKERDWMTSTFVRGGGPLAAVFHSTHQEFGLRAADPVPAQTYIAVWQEDFEAIILAWLVLMGFEDWREIARWKLGSTIARTDGQSGWVRGMCTPYMLMLRRSVDAPLCQSWREAWALNDSVQHFKLTDTDTVPIGDYYLPITRAALAMAVHLGERAAAPCVSWANAQQRRQTEAGVRPNYKWTVS